MGRNITSDMQVALTALRGATEGPVTETLDGWKWRDVYLDNAKPSGWSVGKWAGVLSQLTQFGLYRPYDDGSNDGIWGTVKLDINA